MLPLNDFEKGKIWSYYIFYSWGADYVRPHFELAFKMPFEAARHKIFSQTIQLLLECVSFFV